MKTSRRHFLKASGVIGASSIFLPNLLRAENRGGQKLRIALIGCGGRGRAHVRGYANEQIVALCDVDDVRAAETFDKFPGVPRFKDFRVMLDKMDKQIDAVSIATPDHMHYPIVMWAIAHGKHVLCEKPLTRTVDEAMILKKAVAASGVITQMGNQGHAGDGLRQMQEWINAGLIGEVATAYHWTDRPLWPQGFTTLPKAEPIPSTIDWDLWQGVAPERPFSSEYLPQKWRGYLAYGSGAIGDIACHSMDASYTGLNLGYPTKIVADCVGSNPITFPNESTVTYDFAAREGRGPVQVIWMDGSRRPQDVPFVPNEMISGNESGKKGITSGTILLGSKGAIVADLYGRSPRLLPREYHKELHQSGAMPAETIPRIEGTHFEEWVDGVKNGKQPGGNIFDYAADFTATALLGAVSQVVGGTLDFDAETMRFSNNEAANALLKSQYEYRKEFLV